MAWQLSVCLLHAAQGKRKSKKKKKAQIRRTGEQIRRTRDLHAVGKLNSDYDQRVVVVGMMSCGIAHTSRVLKGMNACLIGRSGWGGGVTCVREQWECMGLCPKDV